MKEVEIMQIGFILSLIFAIIIAIFALQNGDKVTVDFLFADIEVSQAIVIFVSAALGAIIVTILGFIRQVKLSLKIKEQAKRISVLENEKQNMEHRIDEILSNSADKSDIKAEMNSSEQITNVNGNSKVVDNNSTEDNKEAEEILEK